MDSEGLPSRQRLFLTGLLVMDRPEDYPAPPWNGAGWNARLRAHRRGYTVQMVATAGNRNQRAKEVAIVARDPVTAQQALNSIWAALHLLNGPEFSECSRILPARPIASDEIDPDDLTLLKKQEMSTTGIGLACFLAARASHDVALGYALELFQFSQRIHSTHIMDMEPHHSPIVPPSPHKEDHIRLAYAIISAYAAIETLELELRASEKNPSRLANGDWNPSVRADLETRLLKSHVDMTEPALWELRGQSGLEHARPLTGVTGKAPWADGEVRDTQIELVDAIARASWLRSKVSSHKMPPLAAELTIYDVSNVQYVARRLLLSVLGHWRRATPDRELSE